MGTIKALDGNAAIAYGVMRAQVQLVAAYPITPQTPIVETISSLIDTGQYQAAYITAESEHSALSAVIGAASTGVRTFTASASHGLALMHEVTGVASASRLPVVMAVVSRAIPGPMCLWCDHSDIMTQRDQGWIQLFAKSPQEALDFILIAYRTSEDIRVLTPTMVDIDGFFCSHLTEAVDVPSEDEARRFLGAFQPVNVRLDPSCPYAIDNLTSPEIFTELKRGQDLGMRAAAHVLDEYFEQFADIFSRRYGRVMCSHREGAETLVVCMGSMAGTVEHVVNALRKQGKSVGLVRVVTFRPFPARELAKQLLGAKTIAVIDRVSAMGSFGPLYEEVLAAMRLEGFDGNVYSFVAGLGGRDIWERTVEDVVAKAETLGAQDAVCDEPIWIDLKEQEVREHG